MIIEVTGGKVVIDNDDLEKVQQYKWHISNTGYAVWRGIKDGKKQTIRMHRLIANTPHGMITDHINQNRLDNRKENLRACTHSENMRNLSNQGKGYWFQKQNNNWVVEVHGKHIGVFQTEEQAQKIVVLVRNGGTYIKPERTECRYGHSLEDAYIVRGRKTCKPCQSLRSRKYYRRRIAS